MYGSKIRELRLEKGLSQAEFAKKIGTSQRNVSKYENEQLDLSTEILLSICAFFQISADYLLGRSDDLGAVAIQSGAPEITPEEKELVQLYRSLSPQFRKMAIDMLHLWAQQAAAENGSKKHA